MCQTQTKPIVPFPFMFFNSGKYILTVVIAINFSTFNAVLKEYLKWV